MTKCRNRNDAGSALIVALVFVFIVSAFAGAFIVLVHQNLDASKRATHRIENMALAEGGIAKAAAMLETDPAYTGGPPFALGNGTVSVAVAPGAAPDRYIATAVVRRETSGATPFQLVAELVRAPDGFRVARWVEGLR